MHGIDKLVRALIVPIALTLLIISAFPIEAEVASEGTFEATWSLEGSRESIEIEGEPISAYVLTGEVFVRRSDGLLGKFASVCTGVSDDKTGGAGRCTWTDADGDDVLLLFTGKIIGTMGTTRESEGTMY